MVEKCKVNFYTNLPFSLLNKVKHFDGDMKYAYIEHLSIVYKSNEISLMNILAPTFSQTIVSLICKSEFLKLDKDGFPLY